MPRKRKVKPQPGRIEVIFYTDFSANSEKQCKVVSEVCLEMGAKLIIVTPRDYEMLRDFRPMWWPVTRVHQLGADPLPPISLTSVGTGDTLKTAIKNLTPLVD